MASPTDLPVRALLRWIGTPDLPILIDVRIDEDFAADPHLLPTSQRRDFRDVAGWAAEHAGQRVVVLCQKGRKLSQGVAAHLRLAGAHAETLEGGFLAWRAAGGPVVRAEALPASGADGSLWVTRARPKIDRVACPWLLRRFVDRNARFLFVPAADVREVAERFGAIPFDIEDVFWSHRGDECTFDTMVRTFGIEHPPLNHLARIVRAADTARLGDNPEAAGLLALSLGLSRMESDDLAQIEKGFFLYDCLFRWCRDATDETHNWPATGGRA